MEEEKTSSPIEAEQKDYVGIDTQNNFTQDGDVGIDGDEKRKKVASLFVVTLSFLLIVGMGAYGFFYYKNKKNDIKLSSSDKELNEIYDKYCSPKAVVNLKVKSVQLLNDAKNDLSESTKKIQAKSLDNLKADLLGSKVSAEELPLTFYHVGQKMFDGNNFDDGIVFLKCGAEKYYDRLSMAKLMGFYMSGTDGQDKEKYPNMVINNKIEKDYSQSYFWVTAIVFSEVAEETGMLDAGTQLGWNTIATLDALQNGGELTASQMTDIEKSALQFVGKKYPQISNKEKLDQAIEEKSKKAFPGAKDFGSDDWDVPSNDDMDSRKVDPTVPTANDASTIDIADFDFMGTTYSFGWQGGDEKNKQVMYEFFPKGENSENFTKIITIVRDKSAVGQATPAGNEETFKRTLQGMRAKGAHIEEDFIIENKQDPVKNINVAVLSFETTTTSGEIDIKKSFISYTGESVGVTYGVLVRGDGVPRFDKNMDIELEKMRSQQFKDEFIATKFPFPWEEE